ncbi:MAG TPA: tRNA (guanosine(37)-N1)-methyltransferase TrmD [Candidatus Saccharimonadales bacterium]|nr:tRNA (guanosine(37)-N1)-methyltransferase TrmD [Candidatus Saccharimonadales bacterium]
MNIKIITLFPEMISPILDASMLARAQTQGLFSYDIINLRDFGLGPRRQVDDTPYGGGDGMLLKPEPIVAAIEKAKQGNEQAIVVLPTPRGKRYVQSEAKHLAQANRNLIIVCPRYEGYDERIVDYIDVSYRVGDFVLTGGELPALTIIDSVIRLIPGVLGGENSAAIESFQDDNKTIEYPQYTRPEEFRGVKVPDVLLSGNHAHIEAWRKNSQKQIKD